MSERVECPSCAGEKTVTATGIRYAAGFIGPQVLEMPCFVCDGTGSISLSQVERMERGESFRRYRMDVLQLGLRGAADKWGMKASELSQIEQGKLSTYWTPPGWVEPDDKWTCPECGRRTESAFNRCDDCVIRPVD